LVNQAISSLFTLAPIKLFDPEEYVEFASLMAFISVWAMTFAGIQFSIASHTRDKESEGIKLSTVTKNLHLTFLLALAFFVIIREFSIATITLGVYSNFLLAILFGIHNSQSMMKLQGTILQSSIMRIVLLVVGIAILPDIWMVVFVIFAIQVFFSMTILSLEDSRSSTSLSFPNSGKLLSQMLIFAFFWLLFYSDVFLSGFFLAEAPAGTFSAISNVVKMPLVVILGLIVQLSVNNFSKLQFLYSKGLILTSLSVAVCSAWIFELDSYLKQFVFHINSNIEIFLALLICGILLIELLCTLLFTLTINCRKQHVVFLVFTMIVIGISSLRLSLYLNFDFEWSIVLSQSTILFFARLISILLVRKTSI
jgi:hypothetical protein